MNLCLRLAPLAVLLAAAAARADAPHPDALAFVADPGDRVSGARLLVGEGDTLAFSAAEMGGARIVKGAPYCADAELESVQPLTDGNRIVRRQTTRLCRDGEGRTRQEIDRGGRRVVYLRDPAAGESWMLDPDSKTARRLSSKSAPMLFEQPDPSAWREYADRMREYADRVRANTRAFSERLRQEGPGGVPPPAPTPPTPPAAPTPPLPAIVAEGDRELHVLRLDPHSMPMPPQGSSLPLPPGVAMRAQWGAPRGPGVATALGTKDIEGVKANGERTTWTIEAGKLGNEKPILITREVWTSPELMLTVMSRDADPRVGETTYRLAKLKRGEPQAALMRVPPEYASKAASGR